MEGKKYKQAFLKILFMVSKCAYMLHHYSLNVAYIKYQK